MPDPRRSIEIELQWLVSSYSPNILTEIQSLLTVSIFVFFIFYFFKTALEACGTDTFSKIIINFMFY
jgi:hypothetical protein